MVATPRTALLAGATGLVGRELLALLLASESYRAVQVLLRRTSANVQSDPKLKIHEVDFARLPATLPAVDDVFIALGTTIKVAGSRAAFRQVDFDFVVISAQAAKGAGATRLGVVSALGADPKSRIFYSRVKGEMESAIAALSFAGVGFFRPSLLVGDRPEKRLGETLGIAFADALSFALLGPLRKYRPIAAVAVARAMVAAARGGLTGRRVYESDEIQTLADRNPR